jgi:hypothetical protein
VGRPRTEHAELDEIENGQYARREGQAVASGGGGGDGDGERGERRGFVPSLVRAWLDKKNLTKTRRNW